MKYVILKTRNVHTVIRVNMNLSTNPNEPMGKVTFRRAQDFPMREWRHPNYIKLVGKYARKRAKERYSG